MKPKVFTRSKRTWSTEDQALQDVVAKQQLEGQKLETAHTSTYFVWKVVPEALPAAQSSENARFSLAKKDFKTEKLAIDHIITNNNFVHEAQLKPCHTTTYWQFNTK